MGNYDDIINLKRPVSKRHTPMPVENRAAQFSPFAALTGFEKAIDETADEREQLLLKAEMGLTFEEAP